MLSRSVYGSVSRYLILVFRAEPNERGAKIQHHRIVTADVVESKGKEIGDLFVCSCRQMRSEQGLKVSSPKLAVAFAE